MDEKDNFDIEPNEEDLKNIEEGNFEYIMENEKEDDFGGIKAPFYDDNDNDELYADTCLYEEDEVWPEKDEVWLEEDTDEAEDE